MTLKSFNSNIALQKQCPYYTEQAVNTWATFKQTNSPGFLQTQAENNTLLGRREIFVIWVNKASEFD